MKCPRCESNVLDERERSGVTVDVCGQCRGVWLDRGELEKLLSFAKRELEQERSYYGHGPSHDHEPPSSDRRHGYGQGSGHRDQQHRPHKKKSWLENLGDIFD